MRKNVAAFLLGLMMGIKGVSKLTHLIYLGIIVTLVFRPARLVMFVPTLTNEYFVGTVGILAAAVVAMVLISAIAATCRRNW